MNDKQMRLNKIILKLFLVIGLIIASYYVLIVLPEKKLEKNHLYTIVTITDFEASSEGGVEPNFIFSYKSRTYHGSFPIITGYKGKYKVGSRLFFKFSPENPDFGQIIYDIDVPDTLVNPDEGFWKKLPLKRNNQ